jgi:hypothetical protein
MQQQQQRSKRPCECGRCRVLLQSGGQPPWRSLHAQSGILLQGTRSHSTLARSSMVVQPSHTGLSRVELSALASHLLFTNVHVNLHICVQYWCAER